MLKSLKHYSNEDPAGAELIEANYYKEAAKQAGVTVKTLRSAMDRVYADGYYGPISTKDWIVQDGRRRVANIKDALKIIKDAMNYIPDDIEYITMEGDWEEDEDGNALPNTILEGKDIRDEVFGFYYEIYG